MEQTGPTKKIDLEKVVSVSVPNLQGADPAGDRSTILAATLSQSVSQNFKLQSSYQSVHDGDAADDVPNESEVFKLSFIRKVFIGSGHILNDLCASLWFSYLLLYLQNVVGFNSSHAAGLLLLGQIVDGISTPIVGYAEDYINCWLCNKKYGRCKSWHLMGSILVACTFPFIFTECLVCDFGSLPWVKMVYYAPFISVFQVGWATNQISHLALIPKVSPDDIVRTELLAIRYGFTVCANVAIFTMTWLTLGFTSNCVISRTDASNFRNIALFAVGIGILFTVIFHVLVKEEADEVPQREVRKAESRILIHKHSVQSRVAVPVSFHALARDDKSGANGEKASVGAEKVDKTISRSRPTQSSSRETPKLTEPDQRINEETPPEEGVRKMGDWLKIAQFYNVALIYMCTRLTVNLTQCYMPLYLQETLHLQCSTVATVPLTMYISGLILSFFIKFINSKLGRLLSFSIGVALTLVASGCILFLDWTPDNFLHQRGIFIIAALLGGGASAMLVTSLSITADLIGVHFESGAFVYGSMSFCDKIACGFAIMLINSLSPCQQNLSRSCTSELENFYRHVLGYSSGVCALAGLFTVSLRTYLLKLKERRQRNMSTEK